MAQRVISGEGKRGEQGKITGYKKHKWQVQNKQGQVKNSIGNGEAKELICTTNGLELKWGNAGGLGSVRQKGDKGRKIEKTVII